MIVIICIYYAIDLIIFNLFHSFFEFFFQTIIRYKSLCVSYIVIYVLNWSINIANVYVW